MLISSFSIINGPFWLVTICILDHSDWSAALGLDWVGDLIGGCIFADDADWFAWLYWIIQISWGGCILPACSCCEKLKRICMSTDERTEDRLPRSSGKLQIIVAKNYTNHQSWACAPVLALRQRHCANPCAPWIPFPALRVAPLRHCVDHIRHKTMPRK